MKKQKTNDLQERLDPVHIYRDDLLEIQGTIKDNPTCRSFKIETKDCEFDSVEEIPEDRPSTNELSIQSYDPLIRITFTRTNAEVYVSVDTNYMSSEFATIVGILKKRRRKLYHFYKQDFLVSVCVWVFWLDVIIIPAWFVAPIIDLDISPSIVVVNILLITLAILNSIAPLLVFLLSRGLPYYAKIEFSKKSETPSFMAKNRDNIIVGIISGSIVGILVFIITKLFG